MLAHERETDIAANRPLASWALNFTWTFDLKIEEHPRLRSRYLAISVSRWTSFLVAVNRVKRLLSLQKKEKNNKKEKCHNQLHNN